MSNADPKTQRALATMQPFLASFLGLAAVRVWMQSNLFGSYTQSDAGLLSIVNQLFYGLTMLIAACIALRKAPSPSASNAIAWTGCVLMTLSTVFLVVSTEIHTAWAFAATCVLGGIGGAFGGGTWIAAYVRLGVRQAILYGFLSLALGSLGGLALSFMDESSAYVTSMFMPAISLLCYQKAMKAPLAPNPEKPVYDNEPRKTTATFLIGFAIFGLALGISRGFPMGEPVSMGVSGRIVHQLGVVAIALFIVWWTCIAQKRLSFIFLWRIEIALVAGGMLLLSTLPDEAAPFAIAIVNIADTLMLAVIWVTMQDVSRHSSVNPLAIYGFAWAARVLARDLGRVTIIALGATGIASTAANVIIGIVVFALAMSMALLLSGDLPQTRPLFDTGDEKPKACRTSKHAQPHRELHLANQEWPAQEVADTTDNGALQAMPCSACTPPASPDAEEHDNTAVEETAQETIEEWLKRTYGLSNREAEVAALIAQGRSKNYIAETLFVSQNTVRTHAKNAYAKLDIHSNQELIDLVRDHYGENL